MDAINVLGAAITLAFGLLGLLAPERTAHLVGLEAKTQPGRSEFRATYGGLFVALGLAPLILREPMLFALAGLCWLGAAGGRVVSIAFDRAASPKNFAAVGLEATIGAVLLFGRPLDAIISRIGL
ncbi:MAG: DUF4345 family protein [Parvularculaceae bacterium]|nr:DUF4345 family protein [Parvularculaceae bacterium]